MGVLRAGLFYLGLTLATIVVVAPLPVLLLLPRARRHAFLGRWSAFVLWWLRVTCGLDYRVDGLEHLPDRPTVILAKHQSAWETIAFQQIFPSQTWVLKRELLWIPIFGWGLAATHPVAIDRKAGKRALKQVVEQGGQRLAEGLWMVIFPEGTRVAPGERGRYAVGGAMLAKQAGAPVLPVAHNAGEFWPKKGFAKRSGTITVSIGPAIDTTDKSAAEVNRLVEAWIEARMQTLSTDPAAGRVSEA